MPRHTDRTPFASAPISAHIIAKLSATQQDGAHLAAEHHADRLLALEVLVSHADRVLREDPGLRAELEHWVRTGLRPAEGLPVAALPEHGCTRGSSLALRDFAHVEAVRPDRASRPSPSIRCSWCSAPTVTGPTTMRLWAGVDVLI